MIAKTHKFNKLFLIFKIQLKTKPVQNKSYNLFFLSKSTHLTNDNFKINMFNYDLVK